MFLQLVQKRTLADLDRWVDPNRCVNDMPQLAAEVRQSTAKVRSDEAELSFERGRKDRLAVA